MRFITPVVVDARETVDSHAQAGVRPVVPETAEEAAVAQVAESSSYCSFVFGTKSCLSMYDGQLIFIDVQ